MSDAILPEIINVTNPVASKEAKCCECGLVIHKGEKYERATGLWDGNWETFRTCSVCAAQRERFIKESKLQHDELPAYTELRMNLNECGYDLDVLNTRRGK